MSRVRWLYHAALDVAFPPQCAACRRPGTWLCDGCSGLLARLEPPLCVRCAQPLRETAAAALEGSLCPRCEQAPLAVERVLAPFLMQGAARETVHRLKYDGWRVLAKELARPLAAALEQEEFKPDVLVPVPLHPARERQRGYNQAALLAKELGQLVRLPVDRRSLVRSRATPPQARASDVAARRAAVAGAFFCQGAALAAKNVLLVDDVCTTGATLDACAGALLEGGAKRVWALVVAREP